MALTLRPHQIDAAAAVSQALLEADRANVIMPCATGKTLLEIHIASGYRRVLFLEPSLALIRQSLQRARDEGLHETRRLLCVCSDDGIAKDEWRVDERDLGIPVTTDAQKIRDALMASGDGALVFCTYQSLPVLRDGVPEGFEFDIAIFDESHRTAGPIDKAFGVGLRDTRLGIRKWFFATATPRVFSYETGLVDAAATMHSMDDEAAYGKTAYRMSVRDAIEKGIICDYQVLVSATTNKAVREACARAHEMILPQGQLPVELVASQLSVLRAAQVSGARRIVTYHSTIAEAQEFSADSLGLLAEAGFSSFHIYGDMPSRQREAVIEAFLGCEGPALISNARCLSEGVDVPAIDLVALMSKRESVLDVVQILGRALRPYPGKATGYVMLPLFVDSEVVAEQALSVSDLAVTWEILHTILETDDDAVDLHRVGSGGGTNFRSKTGSARHAHLRVVADEELLPALERGITVKPVSRLAHDKDQMLGAARQFKDREGHLRVARDHAEGVLRLGAWLARMRRMRAKGFLSAEIESALVDLGVEFGSREQPFERRVAELKEFTDRTGGWAIPKTREWASLRGFVARVRRSQRNEVLAAEEYDQLKAIGFSFNGRDQAGKIARDIGKAGGVATAWEQLRPYTKRMLRRWKELESAGNLSPNRKEMLQSAGVRLDEVPAPRFEPLPRLQADDSFERSVSALRAFVAEAGDQQPPAGERFQGVDLAEFLRRSRKLLKRDRLSASRAQQLDSLGIEWRTVAHTGSFERQIRQLREFRAAHGHLRLPSTREYLKLRRFVQVQRKRAGRHSAARQKALDDIGFTWSSEADTWDFHIAAMRATLEAGGNVLAVPAHASFLQTLLKKHRAGSLPPERMQVLSELGVPWARVSGADSTLMARVSRLSRKYGKVNLEAILRRHPELALWVSECKAKFARGELDDALTSSLRKLGVRMPMKSAVTDGTQINAARKA